VPRKQDVQLLRTASAFAIAISLRLPLKRNTSLNQRSFPIVTMSPSYDSSRPGSKKPTSSAREAIDLKVVEGPIAGAIIGVCVIVDAGG
jgi:hypothetical protein